jgi:UDP-sulfoquinovose synthase
MKIIVVGGDGFCGWPLSLRLSNIGHEILIVDNLSRRKIDIELSSNSLTPIESIENRILAWKEITNKTIDFLNLDVAKEYENFKQVVNNFRPDSIIHLGEQRAAPYSMKNEKTRLYTVDNNLNATHSILNAIVEINKDIHLVHLGTMGVYGYGVIENLTIPEGYIKVRMEDDNKIEKEVEILYPAYPGSVYHLTKTQDALLFQFYAINYKLKITDLHQGIIWGVLTKETALDKKLINRFDYDSDYGTVLNRFIIQTSLGYPLTIYGTGGQTRAFIHIENSMNCIEIALNNPPLSGDKVKIFNQMTETYNLLSLANLIVELYPETKINLISNPRKELEKNNLKVSNKQFINHGLKPIYLNKDSINEIYNLSQLYKDRINLDKIIPSSFW